MRLINGPEAFTPDGEFILGPTDVRGFWVAAGFCAHGLAGAGGMGEAVAEWIVEGTPSLDVWHMDSRRFGAAYTSGTTRSRARPRSTRPTTTSSTPGRSGRRAAAAAFARLPAPEGLGAAFGEKSAGSGANWFELNAAAGDESLRPRGWAGRHWSPAIGASTGVPRGGVLRRVVVREDRGLGPGAAELLEWLCDNRVARDVGAITYTQMLNRKGGIECDFTVTRLAEERFRVVTGTASAGTIWPGSASTHPRTARSGR